MTDHNAQAHVTGGLAQFIAGADSHRGFMEYLRLKPNDHDKQRQAIEHLIKRAGSTEQTTITLTELLVLRHHYNALMEITHQDNPVVCLRHGLVMCKDCTDIEGLLGEIESLRSQLALKDQIIISHECSYRLVQTEKTQAEQERDEARNDLKNSVGPAWNVVVDNIQLRKVNTAMRDFRDIQQIEDKIHNLGLDGDPTKEQIETVLMALESIFSRYPKEGGETTPTAKRPEVTNRIIALMDAQNTKGLAKYGTTIDEAQDGDYDWRLMAMEELVDLAQYQQKEIMRLERLLNPKQE